MAVEIHVPQLYDQGVKELGEIYENSLKNLLVVGLELYLSMLLVESFFQCPNPDIQDEQELQILYSFAWVPLVLSVFLVYGSKLSCAYAPSPENFDRNVLRGKIGVWIYSFLFLVWDDDMTIKTGPALGVSILFCVCDLARFQMEVYRLIEDDEDEEDEIEVARTHGGDPQRVTKSDGNKNMQQMHGSAQTTPVSEFIAVSDHIVPLSSDRISGTGAGKPSTGEKPKDSFVYEF